MSSAIVRMLLIHDRQFWRRVVEIGLPVSLSSMAYSLLGVADVVMVSGLGQNEIASVSYGARILFFTFFFAAGWAGGLTVLAPQLVGAGERSKLRETTLLTVCILAIALTVMIAGYGIFSEELAKVANNDPAFIATASSYLSVASLSLIFIVIVMPIEINLRSYGKTRAISIIGIVGIILNVIFNYVLINGHFGFPAMGAVGAAWGTVLARGIHAVLLVLLVVNNNHRLFPRIHDILNKNPLKASGQYLSITAPILMQNVAWSLGLVLFNILLGQMGVEEIALFGLINPTESMLMGFFYGFSLAAATILGQSLGANQFELAKKQSVPLLCVPVALAALISSLIWLITPVIEEVYAYTGIQQIEYSIMATWVVAACLCIKVFNMIAINGVLNSGGDVKFSMLVNIISLWGISLPLTYYFIAILQLEIHYVVLAILSEDISKSLFIFFRIRRGHWVKNLTSNKQDCSESLPQTS